MGQSKSTEMAPGTSTTIGGFIMHKLNNSEGDAQDAVDWKNKFPNSTDLQIMKPLWNDSFPGDKAVAAGLAFRGTGYQSHYANALFLNECFMEQEPGPVCKKARSPADLSDFAALKNWMRYGSDCDERRDEAASGLKGTPGWFQMGDCCRHCHIIGHKVDVYHWPEPEADDSCLSIIGDESMHPVDWGATTNTGWNFTYWGCTEWKSGVGRETGILTSSWSFIETHTSASLTVLNSDFIGDIGPVLVKAYARDPWGPQLPCANDSAALMNRTSIPYASPSGKIQAQYLSHNLSMTYNVSSTYMASTLPRIAVSGTYTL